MRRRVCTRAGLGLVMVLAGGVQPSLAAESQVSLQKALGEPEGLTVTGSARVRYETLANQSRAGALSVNDDLISMRSHLFAEYKTGALRFGVDVYDSRAYLGRRDGSVSANDVNAMEPIQLYAGADLGDVFGAKSKTTLQVGRFQLNLASRRLVAADDYRNTMNAFTGVRGDVALPSGVTGVLVYALAQTRLPDDKTSVLDNKVKWDHEGFDQVLFGGYVAKPRVIGDAGVEFTYYHLDEDDSFRPSRDRKLDTAGMRLIQAPRAGRYDYDIEGFYQIGSISASTAATAATLDVSAWFAHAEAGYTWDTAWSPHLSLEVDYSSGDKPGGKYGRFDTLFGMRRGDFPPGGIFTSLGRSNIFNPGFRIEAAPSKRLDFLVSYKILWLASANDVFATTNVIDATGASGRRAGSSVEARVRYWVVPDTVQLEFDGVGLLKGRFLRDAPNAPRTGDTRYLSFNATVFF